MFALASPERAGKLQWGHGREAMDGRALADLCGTAWDFNGAMAVRPWMVAASTVGMTGHELQWGHGREAMDGAGPPPVPAP